MKKQIAVFALVFALAFIATTTMAKAQGLVAFLGPNPMEPYVQVSYPADSATAAVVAIGGLVGTQYLVATDSTIFPTENPNSVGQYVQYIVRKVALHKVASDSGGPEKGYIWIPAPRGSLDDPGRGRWKWGAVALPDGPNADGWIHNEFGNGVTATCLAIGLLGEGQEPVDLMCTTCGTTWSTLPVVGADASLVNDVCPVCGGAAITADTFTVE